MLLNMCYMSNTITHSAVSVICDGAVVVHRGRVNLHVSNTRQVKLPQRVNFSAAVSQNKQTDKQKTISSIITVLKRFAHSNYISNNLIILSVCQVSVDKTNYQRGEGGRVLNKLPALRNIKNKCATYQHGVCAYTCMLRERFTYLCVQAERGTKSAELLISHQRRLYQHTNRVLGLGCLDLSDGVTLKPNTLLIRSARSAAIHTSQTQYLHSKGTLQFPRLSLTIQTVLFIIKSPTIMLITNTYCAHSLDNPSEEK